MNKVILLDTLKEFTEQAIKDLIMPVMRQKNGAYTNLAINGPAGNRHSLKPLLHHVTW